ncbi:response regulator transcription factor [Paenibacillus phocaensis]|uniref:response regulator transcription factor n=1 Tax=Paenibacillus phocaensis TaxID=1776378 RepID=UPI000B0BD1B3|nr:response regulator [Paenibacillus phocaensis]
MDPDFQTNREPASAGNEVKMLIVDDEAVICEGLRYTIDWTKLGVQVVGEAYDGREALRLIEEHGVQLVLSDIRMDGMDGLELAKQLQQRHPDVKVVMISGYEDFEYARQAIRLGVGDYLLKPVDIEELSAVVKNIVADIRTIDKEQTSREWELWLSGMARHSTAFGTDPPSSLNGVQFRIIATQLAEFRERYANMEADRYKSIQASWLLGLHRSLEGSHIRAVSVFDHENRLITLLASETSANADVWDDWLARVIDCLTPEAGGVIYGGVSAVFEDLGETADRCSEAMRLLSYHVLDGRRFLTADYGEAALAGRTLSGFDITETVQVLISALFKQDREAVRRSVEELFHFFRESRYLLPEVWNLYEELFALLRQRLRKSGMTGLDHARQGQPDPNVYNSYAGLESVVLEDMEELQRLIDQNGIDKSYWIIEKAKRFIIDRYRTDLKASEVAAWLKITPSYFSYIFKQSTGKGFTEYMNEMRIEQAKNLLATTQDKVFEIADKVGYKEYKYFVSVFKTYTGLTPKEYRGLRVCKEASGDGGEKTSDIESTAKD